MRKFTKRARLERPAVGSENLRRRDRPRRIHIVRQPGTHYNSGLNVGRGKDDTLFAKVSDNVKFVDKGSMGKLVVVDQLAKA